MNGFRRRHSIPKKASPNDRRHQDSFDCLVNQDSNYIHQEILFAKLCTIDCTHALKVCPITFIPNAHQTIEPLPETPVRFVFRQLVLSQGRRATIVAIWTSVAERASTCFGPSTACAEKADMVAATGLAIALVHIKISERGVPFALDVPQQLVTG